MGGEIAAGFGATDGLQNLRAGRRRLRHYIELGEAPVRGHLPAAGAGIVGRAYSLQQHFVGRRAQSEAESAVAIIGIEPVVAGFMVKPAATPMASWPAPEIWKKIFCWRLSRISRSSTRRERYINPIEINELLAGQTFIGLIRLLNFAVGDRRGFGNCFRSPSDFLIRRNNFSSCIVNADQEFRYTGLALPCNPSSSLKINTIGCPGMAPAGVIRVTARSSAKVRDLFCNCVVLRQTTNHSHLL